MRKTAKWIVTVFLLIVLLLAAVYLILTCDNTPCALLEKIDYGMSRFAVEMKMGRADEESFSKVSDERWSTYVSSYEGIPVEITFTFLQTRLYDKLIGISIRNTEPVSAEEITLITEKMKQKIREAYENADGYYEEAIYDRYQLGVTEGATGIDYIIKEGDASFAVHGYRIS